METTSQTLVLPDLDKRSFSKLTYLFTAFLVVKLATFVADLVVMVFGPAISKYRLTVISSKVIPNIKRIWRLMCTTMRVVTVLGADTGC